MTNQVTRLLIPVGIAYGSDTRKATELLYKVAEDCPDVLQKPKPKVIFDEFGDSTLNFELRCFVNSPELISQNQERFLLNRLRERLPFEEVPIRLVFRARRERRPPP